VRRQLRSTRIEDITRPAGKRPAACVRRQIGKSLHALVFALLLFALPVQADDIEPEPFVEQGIEEAEPESVIEAEEVDAAEEIGDAVANNTAKVAFDVAIIRPLLFVRLVAGCVISAPVALLSLTGGVENVKDMMDVFVYQPYWDTFTEPLGNF